MVEFSHVILTFYIRKVVVKSKKCFIWYYLHLPLLSISNSDSNSDISVSESVATNRRKLLICGESEKVGDNMSMPFIDFLGVGAI